MTPVFEFHNVVKRFGKKTALNSVSIIPPAQSIIGLIGRNGSGKTTLLRHLTGLYLPTEGECRTFGCETRNLGAGELSRIGMMNQHDSFIEWMTAGQFLKYLGSFYAKWDRQLEAELVKTLEIDLNVKTGAMSPGNLQKIGLVAATCHHPELILLDEPLSDLDPIVRTRAVSLLLDRFSDDPMTMVVSSHLLHDIEPIVSHIICLDEGRVVADSALDDLRDAYAEWIVSSPTGGLPQKFSEPFIIKSESDGYTARLEVKHSDEGARQFAHAHHATVETRPLTLERIFRLLVSANLDEHSYPMVNESTKLAGATRE